MSSSADYLKEINRLRQVKISMQAELDQLIQAPRNWPAAPFEEVVVYQNYIQYNIMPQFNMEMRNIDLQIDNLLNRLASVECEERVRKVANNQPAQRKPIHEEKCGKQSQPKNSSQETLRKSEKITPISTSFYQDTNYSIRLKRLTKQILGYQDIRRSVQLNESSSKHIHGEIGDIIKFGKYRWRILDKLKNGNMLILSDRTIGYKEYHCESVEITWENSYMREYLNDEIYKSFNAEDKALIIETELHNYTNPWSGTNGGSKTYDKIFLLSLDEIVKYFGDSGQLRNNTHWKIKNSDGCISDRHNSKRIAYDRDGDASCSWWLRSPGTYGGRVASIYSDGRIYVVGYYSYANYVGGGIRPALWLNPDEV